MLSLINSLIKLILKSKNTVVNEFENINEISKIKITKEKLNQYIRWANQEKKEGRELDKETKESLIEIRNKWTLIKTFNDFNDLNQLKEMKNNHSKISLKCRNYLLWNDYLNYFSYLYFYILIENNNKLLKN
jgi:hypothetical protein